MLLVEDPKGDKHVTHHFTLLEEPDSGWHVIQDVPPEPESDVIVFTMRFAPDGPDYRYAAVRSSFGKWYVTSPRGPRDAKWADLLAFMLKGGTAPTITVPTGYATVEWPDSLANQEDRP